MEEELHRAVEILRQKLNPVAIILFGSRARGNHTKWSDYDLLIIADFREPYLDRIKRVLDVLKDVRIPIEPHPYTLEEAVEMLKRGDPNNIRCTRRGYNPP